MEQSLSLQQILPIIETRDITSKTYPELVELFLNEKDICKHAPLPYATVDPRNQEPVLYNPSRRLRPTDYRRDELRPEPSSPPPCIICAGKTTRILDLVPLSEGFTFINKNLFPAIFPHDLNSAAEATNFSNLFAHREVRGLHFLQWTSSFHNHDWHTMPAADRLIVMQRLASLEKQLLTTSGEIMPPTTKWGDPQGYAGFVSIIKNGGRLVGGSIAHGHQQIVFSNLMPRRTHENWQYYKESGEYFSEFILKTTPPELCIREYDNAVLLVPPWMRRPGDMLLILKNTQKRYLHQLNNHEMVDVARGWFDALRAIRTFMPAMNRPVAYNVTTHNGPGAGLYFSFLPYTQETGGLEHLGIAVCLIDPFEMARIIRTTLEDLQGEPSE